MFVTTKCLTCNEIMDDVSGCGDNDNFQEMQKCPTCKREINIVKGNMKI